MAVIKHLLLYGFLILVVTFSSLPITFAISQSFGIIFAIPSINLMKSFPWIYGTVITLLYLFLFLQQIKNAPSKPIILGTIILIVIESILFFGFKASYYDVGLGLGAYILAVIISVFFKKEEEHKDVFFALSPIKLTLMHFLTFGTYHYVWWYKNWRFIRTQTQGKFWLILRVLFPIFYYEDFLQKVNVTSRSQTTTGIKFVNYLTDYYVFILIGYFVMVFVSIIYTAVLHNSSFFPYNTPQISFLILSFVLYLFPQFAINRINKQKYRNNIRFLDVILILIGAAIWLKTINYWVVDSRSDAKNAAIYYDYKFFKAANEKASLPAEEGDREAQFLLGNMYFYGLGVTKNPEYGMDWLEQAADQGHVDAQYNLGLVYYYGTNGIKVDYEKSALWWEKAAEGGNREAMNNLALLYLRGKGVAKNPAKAKALYQQAAAKGDELAMYNIGLDYSLHSKTPDYKKAFSWFEKSIQAKPNHCALNDIGMLYAAGKGVEPNAVKAKKAFADAARDSLLIDYKEIFTPEFNKEIFSEALTNKIKKDEYKKMTEDFNNQIALAYADYQYSQYAQARNTKDFSQLEKQHSPVTIKAAKKISQHLVKDCWEQ